MSEMLSKNPAALQKFEVLLFQTGYVEREEYGEHNYRLAETKKFTVDKTFPRLTKNNLPPSIVEASYALNLREFEDEFLNEP